MLAVHQCISRVHQRSFGKYCTKLKQWLLSVFLGAIEYEILIPFCDWSWLTENWKDKERSYLSYFSFQDCQPNCVGPDYNGFSNKISLYFLVESNTSFILARRVSWYSNTNWSYTGKYFLELIRFELLQKHMFLQYDLMFPHSTSLFLIDISYCIPNPAPTILCTPVCVCVQAEFCHPSFLRLKLSWATATCWTVLQVNRHLNQDLK